MATHPKRNPSDEPTWLSYIGLVGMNTALLLAALSWVILGLSATPSPMLPRAELVHVHDMGIYGYVTRSVDDFCGYILRGAAVVFGLGLISAIAHVIRTRDVTPGDPRPPGTTGVDLAGSVGHGHAHDLQGDGHGHGGGHADARPAPPPQPEHPSTLNG